MRSGSGSGGTMDRSGSGALDSGSGNLDSGPETAGSEGDAVKEVRGGLDSAWDSGTDPWG